MADLSLLNTRTEHFSMETLFDVICIKAVKLRHRKQEHYFNEVFDVINVCDYRNMQRIRPIILSTFPIMLTCNNE